MENPTTNQEQDIEAQTSDPFRLTLTKSATQTPYSKIGRGGAGNVVYTPESETAGAELSRFTTTRDVNETVVERKKGPQIYQRHVGRGGAGNWRGNLEDGKEREREEERVRMEVEARVESEVGMSLQAPGRVYRVPRDEEKVRK